MTIDTVDTGRRRFLTNMTAGVGGVGACAAAYPFLAAWQPSAKARAAGAPVEADISKIEPGQKLTFEWRGKPVWIVSRSPEQVEEIKQAAAGLKDPESTEDQQPEYAKNIYRSIKPEISVLVGICTHLGCSPTFKPNGLDGRLGGFFCPCHGSKFDLAGRVFENVPAQLNLVVPPHKYINDHLILIGEDGESA